MTVIIDYGAGNLTSVRLALEHLGFSVRVSSDAAVVSAAGRLVFPGVGAAGAAMNKLKERGLDAAVGAAVARGVPFLGICLGAQIVFERSAEDGGVECLGLLPGDVRALPRGVPGMKIPHIGWNGARFKRNHPLLEGIRDGSAFYFVHTFYPHPAREADVLAVTDHAGVTFASIAGRANVCVTQFHPERSGPEGLRLLDNFMRWNGEGGAAC